MVVDYSIFAASGPSTERSSGRDHRPECAHFPSVMPALTIIIFSRFCHFMSITPYLLLCCVFLCVCVTIIVGRFHLCFSDELTVRSLTLLFVIS